MSSPLNISFDHFPASYHTASLSHRNWSTKNERAENVFPRRRGKFCFINSTSLSSNSARISRKFLRVVEFSDKFQILIEWIKQPKKKEFEF